MILTRKNLILSIVFIMGMILSYGIYYQYNNSRLKIEFVSQSSSSSESFTADSGIHEEDQVIDKVEILSFVGINKSAIIIAVNLQLSQPSFSFWQPPKI
jgi:hypothetical protein